MKGTTSSFGLTKRQRSRARLVAIIGTWVITMGYICKDSARIGEREPADRKNDRKWQKETYD